MRFLSIVALACLSLACFGATAIDTPLVTKQIKSKSIPAAISIAVVTDKFGAHTYTIRVLAHTVVLDETGATVTNTPDSVTLNITDAELSAGERSALDSIIVKALGK